MKYCRYCGSEVADEAIICVHCGRLINEQPAPAQQKSGINIMCLLGFIFSFVMSIVGLILSIVGYNQVKNTDDSSSKTMAKAGIIISSVSLGLALFVFVIYFGLIWSLIMTGIYL